MKRVSIMRQNLEEAGFKVVAYRPYGQIVLKDTNDGNLELWQRSPKHAGYALTIGGFDFEFIKTLS